LICSGAFFPSRLKNQRSTKIWNSYERKIVHEALQGFKYIKSDSEGTEPNRYVVIKYYESENG